MRYDLMVAVGTKDATSLTGKLEKFIKDAAAQEVKVEKLGKKTLAYPIAKQQEAEYFLFNFEAPAEAISQITQNLRLERETILRYLITKVQKESKKETKRQRVKEIESEKGREVKETGESEARKIGRVIVKTVTGKETKGAGGAKVSEVAKVAKVTKVAKVAKGTKELKSTKGIKETKVTKAKGKA